MYGTHVHGSGAHSPGPGTRSFAGCCESKDSLQPFFRWITVPSEARPEVECARITVKIFVDLTDRT